MKCLLSLALGLLLAHSVLARAHDPGLSSAEVRLGANRIMAHLTFSRSEIQSLGDLERMAVDALAIALDGRPVPGRLTRVELASSDALHLELVFEVFNVRDVSDVRAMSPASRLYVSSPLLPKLARGHRQFVSVRDESGAVVTERVLNASSPGFAVVLEDETLGAQGSVSFNLFLSLGLEHILTGYDHLLFLFGLLIVGGGFWSAARIITSFTVAHSITLALATFDVVRIPTAAVEPLIAASILYVGVANLTGCNLRRRWLLTFGFGLVHGLGFASVLLELGIGAGNAIVPLLAFNLGVELGQIGVAAIVLPLIWWAVRHRSLGVRFATAGSLVVTLAGGFWLFERVFLA